MAVPGRGVRSCSGGACMVAPWGHAWLLWGVRGCFWGVCMVAPGGACVVAPGGACMGHDEIWGYDQ